jgi:hypothetical protein
MDRSGSSERRKTPRHPIFVEGTLSFAGRYRLKCLVQNLSEGGAKLAFSKATNAPAEFTLSVIVGGEVAQYSARTVWRNWRSVGVEFVRPRKTNATASEPVARPSTRQKKAG